LNSANQANFHSDFIEDLKYWLQRDRKIALKIFDIVESVIKNPFAGIGKPEPLKHALKGCWSRRLTQEHRIVYCISGKTITFLQAMYHY